jgi:hypothetical protein
LVNKNGKRNLKMKYAFLSLCLALALSLSCSVNDSSIVVYGTPVTYEGEYYQTVVIGSQTWMAKNLNYAVSGSECYEDLESNCDIYGRLYDWITAMGLPSSCNYSDCSSSISGNHRGICPPDGHIPRDSDWDVLRPRSGIQRANT